MSYGSEFVLTLFTNDPALAARADAAGIDRVGLDLERGSKMSRQDPSRTWISDHEEPELAAIAGSLRRAQPFVRTDAPGHGLKDQLDRVIAAGAKVVMLPYFFETRDAARFLDYVNGRAKVVLLVETAAAAARIHELVRLDGVDEIHVGLNDLYLTLGLASHFELLASPILRMISDAVCDAGLPFGFGGIGRYGDTRLPVSPDLVYAQHPRFHSTRALVSRVFLTPDPDTLDLTAEVARFRARMDHWASRPPDELAAAHDELYAAAQRQRETPPAKAS